MPQSEIQPTLEPGTVMEARFEKYGREATVALVNARSVVALRAEAQEKSRATTS